MSWSAEGYNPKVAQAMKANANPDPHLEIAAMCRQFAAGLSEYAEPAPEPIQGSLAAIEMKHEIIAAKDKKLDVGRVLALKQRWIEDRKKAKVMTEMLNNGRTLKGKPATEQKQRFINFCAVRAAVRE